MRIAAALILFFTAINIYLICMVFGQLPVIHTPITYNMMRTWFSGSIVFLLCFVINSLYNGIKQRGQFECTVISLLSIGAAQLIVWLNGVHLISNPYYCLGIFNACSILAFFTIFNYLSLNNNGTNSAGD